MRVLVTGGSGLVGRNVREALADRHEILAPPRAELNLLDGKAVTEYLKKNVPDMIIHCAGLVGGIQANIREPSRFLVENFELGKNVVLAAVEAGVPRIINLGSSCMYPRLAPNPLKEEQILSGELEPTNEGYAIAKIAIQRLCAYITAEHRELAYKTIIPCNLYGKWDTFDPSRSHMVPAIIRKLHEAKRSGSESVDVWGSGKSRREFMYAGDLGEFMVYALDRFERMPDLLNVGTGRDYTVDEYYLAAAEVIGYTGGFRHDPTKPEGMARKLVDTTVLEKFGWKARTPLEDGLRKTYGFFLDQEPSE